MGLVFRLGISACIGLAAISGFQLAEAQVVFETNFSEADGYVDGHIAGQPAGAEHVWRTFSRDDDPNPGTPGDSFNIEDGDLHVINTGWRGKWSYLTFPVQSGEFTVEWTFQFSGPEEGNMDIGFAICDSFNFMLDGNPSPNFNELSAIMRTFTDGEIDAYEGNLEGGGGYTRIMPLDYKHGNPMHVRMEIDADNWLYNVYVLVEGETEEVEIAYDFQFRRITSEQTGGLNSLVIWDNGNSPEATDSGSIVQNFRVIGASYVDTWSLY